MITSNWEDKLDKIYKLFKFTEKIYQLKQFTFQARALVSGSHPDARRVAGARVGEVARVGRVVAVGGYADAAERAEGVDARVRRRAESPRLALVDVDAQLPGERGEAVGTPVWSRVVIGVLIFKMYK